MCVRTSEWIIIIHTYLEIRWRICIILIINSLWVAFLKYCYLFKTVYKLDVEYAGLDPSEMSGMQAFNLF